MHIFARLQIIGFQSCAGLLQFFADNALQKSFNISGSKLLFIVLLACATPFNATVQCDVVAPASLTRGSTDKSITKNIHNSIHKSIPCTPDPVSSRTLFRVPNQIKPPTRPGQTGASGGLI